MAEYYAKVGIEYVAEFDTGEQVPSFGLQVGLEGQNLAIIGLDGNRRELWSGGG